MKKSAFTLIELIVVIAIIAILASIVTPSAFRAIEKAQVQKAVGDLKVLSRAAMQYYADTGQWPPAISTPPYGGGFLIDVGVVGWDGPYLEQWPKHPWYKGVSDPTSYQWDLKDVDGDGLNEWCVEIGLGDVNDTRRNYIASLIDKTIDSSDGACAGNFRAYCPPGPNDWATWPKLIVADD